MPPVNATASKPPMAAANAPMLFFTSYTKTSSAISARRLPWAAAASRSRTSPPSTPERPAKPPPLASWLRTSWALHPWRSIM